MRSESGRSDPTTDHAGEHVANVPRGSRKDVRDAVKAARGARRPAGRSAPPTTAARCSTASPRRWSRAPTSSPARRWPSRTCRCPPPAPSSARRSTCSSTTRAGRTSSAAVMGGINPVAGAVPVVLDARADRRRRRARARRARRARAGPRDRAGAGRGQHGRRVVSAPLAAARARPRRGRRRLRRPRRRAEPAVRPARRAARRRCAATATSTRSSTPPATRSAPRRSTSWRPRRSSASRRPAPDGDPLARLEALIELKTAWHPVGLLTAGLSRRRARSGSLTRTRAACPRCAGALRRRGTGKDGGDRATAKPAARA